MAFLFPKACESTSGIGRPFLVVDMIRFSLSVGRTSDLPVVRPADKGRRIISMKRKELPIQLVLSQAFENRKAIAH